MFLFSFDLIELNTFYNYFIYCLFIVLEYIFIAYYPLNQIYQNKTIYVLDASNTTLTSTGVNTILTYQEVEIYPKNFTGEYADTYIPSIVQYLNIDFLLNNLNYISYIGFAEIFCHCLTIFNSLLTLMTFTRKLGTISLSSQRKIITKAFVFGVVTLTRTLQVPLLSFMLTIYSCDNNVVSIQENINFNGQFCYQGIHLQQIIYSSLILVVYYGLVAYFHNFLTLSYPHEKIAWARLPSKISFFVEFLKLAIVFSYKQTTISYNALSYVNIVFCLAWLLVLYKRLFDALIFHTTVYLITICGESCMFVLFGYAALRDFVSIDRDFIFHIILIGSCLAFAMTSVFLREKIRYKFLSKVDFALYEKDFEALIMMFTLHELIERSSYDDKEDFILRGFIERHIEICEYPTCSCIKFYQICNQNYRLELAQMSPFSKNYDSSSMAATNTQTKTTTHQFSQKEQSDAEDLSTLKVFYGRQKSQKKQNKSKQKFLKKFLIDNINVFLDAFPNSVKLHIMAAFIYFSIFKNSFKSLYELSFTKSIKSSTQNQYECFVLSSQIIAYFQSRASQGMSNQPVQLEKPKDEKRLKKGMEFNSSSFEVETEIKSVIEFEKVNIKFQKMIEMTSIETREFWEEILKKNIDVKKIFDLGARIYKSFIEIKKKYKHLMSMNNNYLEVAYLYKLFVSLILNFEIEVEDAKLEIVKIMQSKSMRKHNLKTEYKSIQLQDENGMIIISGSTNNFAKILAMNNKAERIFGYLTNELIGQKLTRLMPKLFMENHESFILNFVNGNRKINKDNHNFCWGKHKTGFIVPLIMDINAYVNFEFNFCFIAFLKRSVLLEFRPMRELLEYQDVFVLQTNSNGIIQDMTQNMQEYLNFPLQALSKELSAECFFRNIFEDETETQFMGGKRVEFDPASIKRLLEEEDIDVRDNESDGGTNYNMSEKKCTAIVWLKTFEYDYQDVKLVYKEIWYVLTDDDASFLDTKGTTEYLTAMGDDGPKVNVTYTDDREEICSIASVSSLANYDKNRKNILNKLSEIKTQTIDDQKPRQIDLLQKAIIIVFLSVIGIAMVLLIVSTNRNNGFFSNVEIIKQSKESDILFSQIRTMIATVVTYANSKYSYANDPNLSNLTSFIVDKAQANIGSMRTTQSQLNFASFSYSSSTLAYKESTIDDYLVIKYGSTIVNESISQMQGIQDFLDKSDELTQQVQNYTFNTSILNYDNTNYTQYKGQSPSLMAVDIYEILKNSLGSIANYLYLLSEDYISDSITQANNNQSLVLILTIISITITFLTAFVIVPILHKIERSKEKVLMIYTELKKEQIESLNRNIKVFFMKLQQSTNTLGGSLLYQNSSKQFSGKLVTRKFTTNVSMRRGGQPEEQDFGFLLKRAAPIGVNDALKEGQEDGDDAKGNVKSHFPLLFNNNNKQENKRQTIQNEGDGGKQGGKKSKKPNVIKLGGNKGNKIGGKNNEQKLRFSQQYQDDESDGEKSEEEVNLTHNNRRAQEDESDLSENAEEDKKAQILMSKEEAENALFKRIFQNKIRQMTCMRQVKYYLLVGFISLFMSGYFTLSYFMVTNIFNASEQSLNILEIVGNRGPYLDSLLAYFLQTLSRGQEIYIQGFNDTTRVYDSVDFYYQETQNNENSYNSLRQSIPSMIQGSASLISGLESQSMCDYLITSQVSGTLKDQQIALCQNISNKILQLGLTQTINTILQDVLQGILTFRNGQQLSYAQQQQLLTIIYVKMKYLNDVDLNLLESVKESIISYFTGQQQSYIITFSVFVVIVVLAMILLSYTGVEYLFKNFIAVKFILNFIPGQWLLDNNAADDLKYIDF